MNFAMQTITAQQTIQDGQFIAVRESTPTKEQNHLLIAMTSPLWILLDSPWCPGIKPIKFVRQERIVPEIIKLSIVKKARHQQPAQSQKQIALLNLRKVGKWLLLVELFLTLDVIQTDTALAMVKDTLAQMAVSIVDGVTQKVIVIKDQLLKLQDTTLLMADSTPVLSRASVHLVLPSPLHAPKVNSQQQHIRFAMIIPLMVLMIFKEVKTLVEVDNAKPGYYIDW
jgi:hypothetical protein